MAPNLWPLPRSKAYVPVQGGTPSSSLGAGCHYHGRPGGEVVLAQPRTSASRLDHRSAGDEPPCGVATVDGESRSRDEARRIRGEE